MAACTLAARIEIDLQILASEQTLIDATNQRDTAANTVNTTRLTRCSQLAAAKIEGRLGSLGTVFDDSDGTVGGVFPQAALAIGIEYAECLLSAFNTTKNEAVRARITELVGPGKTSDLGELADLMDDTDPHVPEADIEED